MNNDERLRDAQAASPRYLVDMGYMSLPAEVQVALEAAPPRCPEGFGIDGRVALTCDADPAAHTDTHHDPRGIWWRADG